MPRHFVPSRAGIFASGPIPARPSIQTKGKKGSSPGPFHASLIPFVFLTKAGSQESAVEIVDEVICDRDNGHFRFTIGGVAHDGISWHRTTVANVFASNARLASDHFRGM